MTRGAAYLVACAALIGAALGYALPSFTHLPSLFYDPLARSFFVGGRTGSIPMGYYGQILWGAAGALVAGALVAVAYRRREPSDTAVGLAAAWAVTAVCLVGIYFTWNNWP